MAFEKLTLFEIRMDGAKFGGESGVDVPDETGREVQTESSTSGSGAGTKLATVVVLVGLSVAATAIARKLSGEPGESADIEFEEIDEITA
ncbi:hypothetical protein [Haloarchaeobius sp. TZWWS8]|uniref:hypothetical protein n=1 Tax=Haloarchaeobius sp. TZWWS8 TaxID=3446121 RepID=UPI003EBAC646